GTLQAVPPISTLTTPILLAVASAISVSSRTYPPTAITKPFIVYLTLLGALCTSFSTRLSNVFNAFISSSSSGLMLTILLKVAHPADATCSSLLSIHSRASSHPCGFSDATHGTEYSLIIYHLDFLAQSFSCFLVILLPSAIKPARYMASHIPLS